MFSSVCIYIEDIEEKYFISCACLALVSERVYNWGDFGLFFSVESS